MSTLKYADFKGPAKAIEDLDLPRIGHTIGVGEDELHAFMDVEAAGSPFDASGRPKMLFEPHRFYANLTGTKRADAVKKGLAYSKWKPGAYPKDSYPRLIDAMKIDPEAALKSASWGLGQVMGENYKQVGFDNVFDMVNAACEDAENHLVMMVNFLVTNHIDDDMRTLAALKRPTTPADCAPIVRVYNGSRYAENDYHTKFAKAHNKWRGIKDTPWTPEPEAPIITAPTAAEADAAGFDVTWIKRLQQMLKDKGYIEVGKIDGDIGKNTLAAISAFQIAQGLPVTGKVSAGLMDQLAAAPMRPVSVERANATVETLVAEKQPLINEAIWLRRAGTIATGAMGLGAVFDGGDVDLDKVIASTQKLRTLYEMVSNIAPWLIGAAAAGTVLYFAHKLISKQVAGFRKGTIR